MIKMKSFISILLLITLTTCLSACQSYQRQVMPVKMPSSYPNATEVAGATIAAKIYDDKNEAEAFYGFDIIGTGVIPLQLIFDNKGIHSITIISSQTFPVRWQAKELRTQLKKLTQAILTALL
jgi:hypothetical protein